MQIEQLLILSQQSTLISKAILEIIYAASETIITEKYIISQMPIIGFQWYTDQASIMIKKFYTQNDDDDLYVEIIEDTEPQTVPNDHWKRFQGQMSLIKSRGQSPIKRSDTKRITRIQQLPSQREITNYNSQVIKIGELDDDIDFDPNIESIRQAKLRQLSIQQQKIQHDKQKVQETQEQVKQLKRLNVDSKSKYTYDYEGKVVVQKLPDTEKYPKSHYHMQEKTNLIEVRETIPFHKIEQEQILQSKRQSLQNMQTNQFLTKTYVPPSDVIIMKEGVTFYDGKIERKKERYYPLMEMNDEITIRQTLLNSNVQMTKSEYEKVTNTQSAHQIKNNSLQISFSQPQLKNITSRTYKQDDTQINNNDSLFSNREHKPINHSISSTLLNKLNGSISILSEQQLEELLTQSNDKDKIKDKSTFKQNSDSKKQSPIIQPLILELPQISPNILSNTLSKLPKTFTSQGSFPKLLVKYPRERLTKYAMHVKQ